MSIYSGFATRNLETLYNKHLANLVYLLQSHLCALLSKNFYSETINLESWGNSYSRTIHSMLKLEQQKHLEPSFTNYCQDLSKHLQIDSQNRCSRTSFSRSISNVYTEEVDRLSWSGRLSQQGKYLSPSIQKKLGKSRMNCESVLGRYKGMSRDYGMNSVKRPILVKKLLKRKFQLN